MGNKIQKIKQDNLSPAYVYDFKAHLWRLKLDTATGRLALEVRDGDVLLARFFTLDCHTFTLLQLDLPVQQLWWQGLEDAQHGLVLLHGYGDRKLGQHKGITALSGTGTVAWEQPELAFYGIGAAGVYAYPVAAPENGFCVLDEQTGTQKALGLSQQQAAAAVADFYNTRYNNCVFPMFYQEGEVHFETLQAFLEAQLGAQPVQAIEYAETAGCLVASYYEKSGEAALTNKLVVFDLDGHFHFAQTLADGLSGIGSDTFFIFMDSLYFIQNKTILQVHLLPQGK